MSVGLMLLLLGKFELHERKVDAPTIKYSCGLNFFFKQYLQEGLTW